MLAHVVNHPGAWKAADIEMEQDPDRPYVYVCGFTNFDTQIYDVRDPAHPKKLFDWTIENPELHRGIGAMDGKYFKIGNQYYYAQSFQFMQGSPDADLGAVDLRRHRPARLEQGQGGRPHPLSRGAGRLPQHFAYKHSDGRVLLLRDDRTSTKALIYDLAKVVSGADSSSWLVGERAESDAVQADRRGRLSRLLRRLRPGDAPGQVLRRRARRLLRVGRDPSRDAERSCSRITGLGIDIAHTFTPSPDGDTP